MRRMGSRASLPISLTFKPFDFHGHLANRQVVSFGYRYATTVVLSLRLRRSVVSRFPAEQGCRDIWRAAEGVPSSADQRVSTGRENWLASRQGAVQRGRWRIAACTVRAAFRRKAAETWDRVLLAVEPRSAYLLSGAARTVWEHSIPALDQLRYSITMRTHIAKGPSGEERT